MKRKLQRTVQIGFLALFLFLFAAGRVQMWMGLLLLGILASFLLGRVYCGWICSINTVMLGVSRLKKKLHIKSLPVPSAFSKPWVRHLALGVFIGLFLFSMATGRKVPVLPALFALGAFATFFFPEELWHQHLCPYGTLMLYPASKSPRGMAIDADLCNNCGACRRACPALAVEKGGSHHFIHQRDCLVCMECERSCRQDAIRYR
ncbi:4Fe-4S binding protein [Anaerotalea alkaliphila]|uniref:4Fe-4S binding protein n=1 Tax=Anaerotalea alkaliphila TaxID=2662126 RepID=A0A7X5HVM1_9FIRM|nr:4Fe-4S binding protein [Anaerotalea alkaliphila]NDL67493.1 4Fe-4S binding protein [Anaerotalea alkaliphila]